MDKIYSITEKLISLKKEFNNYIYNSEHMLFGLENDFFNIMHSDITEEISEFHKKQLFKHNYGKQTPPLIQFL